ncbi:hypothetical protein NYO91_16185 [Arhodomonas aquaeolei]|uniref:hypothetical protein n=1 Tax=Arhodomonas aquaeolei TaxID=2369 RepID=UPI002169DB69|nr:hypothetical protein [Arhodomonas aquaeolei]MCS4505626.1 hypothetical protein [Arhodomonas aquaeolei]
MNQFSYSLIFCLGLMTVLITGCSKDGHIVIGLSNKHLEETAAGEWLKIFDIDYAPGAERMKKQVTAKLQLQGTLIDEYAYESGANRVMVRVWLYEGTKIKEEYYKGGIWEGPEVVPFQEYYAGGRNSWITIEFDGGVPYSELLPAHYTKITQNRKYEHTATIKSSLDQDRRLFLFGYGDRCQRISLF